MPNLTLKVLRRIAASVDERRGWDFSKVRDARDPVPWDYADVVRRYLQPSHHVLDIGTGGGERFLALASYLSTGVGIDADPAMIRVARENRAPSLAGKITLEVMCAEALRFSDDTFDVVLNRHAPVQVQEIARVLRPDGYFITQQVGARNARNICAVFGCGPGGEYEVDPAQDTARLAAAFQQNGCTVIGRAEYDVRYWFQDVESFVFWLQAIPLPEDFNIETHWRGVNRMITAYRTPKGIETNEHRQLLIVHKRRSP
jgi:SAM-dependent methyltransferase